MKRVKKYGEKLRGKEKEGRGKSRNNNNKWDNIEENRVHAGIKLRALIQTPSFPPKPGVLTLSAT